MIGPIKKVTLSADEFIQTLSIVKVIRNVSAEQHDDDDADFMTHLIDELLKFKCNEDTSTTIELDMETRFALWLSIDTYKEFCIEKNLQSEITGVERLMSKFR